MRRTEPQRTLEYFLQRLGFLLRAKGIVLYRLSPSYLLYPAGFFFREETRPEIPNINLNQNRWFAQILEQEITRLTEQEAQEKGLFALGPALITPVYSKRRDPKSGRVIEKELEGMLVVTGKQEEEAFNQDDETILLRLTGQVASIIITLRILDYEIALERFPVGILSLDPTTGRILLCNARACEAIGQDEVIGRDYKEVTPLDLQELIQNVQRVGQVLGEITSSITGKVFRVEALYRPPVNEYGINQVVLGFVDATYVRQTEAIVAQMSHDLRTPLTSIQGYMQTLIQGIDQKSRVDTFDLDSRMEFYQIILDQAQLLYQMIDQLLSIARLRAGKALELNITEFDLVQLISEMMRVYADRFTTAHHPVLEMPESLIISADRTKIQQVILNLITNAVKYSPEGGEVKIKVEDLGEEVMISVSDQGIGIKQEDIARIGDWCFRTDYSKDISSGIGIGMFFVRNLVEAHGGRLTIESKGLGKGSTFSFIIPKKALKR
jgi:two-component system phosphate regulon sensor histidine kinase PhoR